MNIRNFSKHSPFRGVAHLHDGKLLLLGIPASEACLLTEEQAYKLIESEKLIPGFSYTWYNIHGLGFLPIPYNVAKKLLICELTQVKNVDDLIEVISLACQQK